MAGAGISHAAIKIGILPNNICHAVSVNKSSSDAFWCSFWLQSLQAPSSPLRALLKTY
jgi:hypothetical protein